MKKVTFGQKSKYDHIVLTNKKLTFFVQLGCLNAMRY